MDWRTMPARTRGLLVVAAVLLLGVVIWTAAALRADPTVGQGASTPSPPAAATPTPTDSADPTTDPTEEPTVAPTEEPTPPPTEGESAGDEAQALPPAGEQVPVPPLAQPPAGVTPLAGPATVADQVVVTVSRIQAIDATGTGPGEISGPALAVTVEVRNGSARPVDLTTAGVNVYYGSAGTPASPVSTDPTHAALAGEVAPGGTVTGTYVVRVPPEERGLVSVVVELLGTGTAIFEGPATIG